MAETKATLYRPAFVYGDDLASGDQSINSDEGSLRRLPVLAGDATVGLDTLVNQGFATIRILRTDDSGLTLTVTDVESATELAVSTVPEWLEFIWLRTEEAWSLIARGGLEADADVVVNAALPSVRVATTAALPAHTRSGNTLTASGVGALGPVDGVTLIDGDTVLVLLDNEENGGYVLAQGTGSAAWILTRASWLNETAEAVRGLLVGVREGSANGGFFFVLSTTGAIALNTTALEFQATSGYGAKTGTFQLAPLGNGLDDWPRLIAALETFAQVQMLHGTWTCDSSLRIPSNACLIGSPGVTVVCTLPQSSIEDSPFALISTGLETLAFAVNNVVGTATIRLTTSPAAGVGSWLDVRVTSSHLSGSVYQIVSITPNGPNFDIVVDRAVLYQAVAGTAIAVSVEPCSNVRIHGGGMRVVGVCNDYVEPQGAIDCILEDITFDGSTAAGSALSGLQADTFSLRCVFRNIRLIGPSSAGSTTGAWFIGESHVFEGISVTGWGTGIVASDMIMHGVRDVTSYGNGTGLLVTSDGGAAFTPSYSTHLHNVHVYGNVSNGIVVTQGARQIVFHGGSSQYNGAAGVVLSDVNGAPVGTRFIGMAINNNGSNGFADVVTATGTQLIGCDISNNVAAGLLVAGEAYATGLTGSGGGTATVQVVSGGRCVVDGFEMAATNAGAPVTLTQGTGRLRLCNGRIRIMSGSAGLACQFTGTARCEVIGARFTFDIAGQSILGTGGVIVIDDCFTDGAAVASSIAVNLGSGTTARVGRCNFDNCALGFNFNSGSMWSRTLDDIAQTLIVATGSTPVDVPFTDLRKSDVITLTRVVDGGTPGNTPRVTKVVSTKWQLTADAGDTSTYAYVIH